MSGPSKSSIKNNNF
uniref:Uncharacterized protein n=1 Tax=Lepeophtheirus salmonis TaxID=72036 RepID=A0A0K2VDV8_LEPSM